jgi:UDP-N-acetylglucosamine acyltransferase
LDLTPAIHPTALVHAAARLGEGCVVHAHAVITQHCELGPGVIVHPFAVVGGDPQDLSFDPATPTSVRIGARTVIREHVTISRATRAGSATEVGADCFLMASCHVAHDCRIGERVVIANAVLLAGHVQIGDRAFLGGGAVIHQFCRIGEGAMIGGGARISRDIAPFCLATERNALIGLNVVGLRRRGLPRSVLHEIKRAFRALDQPTGDLRQIASNCLQQGDFSSAEARSLLQFFQGGRRAFARTRRGGGGSSGAGGSGGGSAQDQADD